MEEGLASDTAGARANGAGWNGPTPLMVAVMLGALPILGVMALPLFFGQVNVNNDLGWVHLPTRIFYADSLAKGEAFDWMPEIFSGYYLTGSGDVAGYHPFHWLLYRWLPLPVAFEIEVLAAYPFLFLGMFLWLRRLGMPREAAAAGGVVFTFSSFNLLHFIHPNIVTSVAHLPWLLAAIDVAVCDPASVRRSGARLAIALLTGSQILLASPQMVWLSLIVEAGYTLFLLFRRRDETESKVVSRASIRTCLELVAAIGVGVMLGAIQIVPMIDAWALSVRHTTSSDFVNSFSLHPLNVVQLIAPYMFKDRVLLYNTHEFGLYIGAVPLLLILWLPGRAKELGALRGLMWAATALAALGMVLSFGPLGLLYRLQQFLPLVRGFRCSCRYLMFAELAASLLASLGLLLLIGQVRRGRLATRRELRPIVGLVLCSVAAAAIGLVLRFVPATAWLMASPYEILAGPVVFSMAALLFCMAARGRRIGLAGLIVFMGVDLGVYGLSYIMPPWNVNRIEDYMKSGPSAPAELQAAGGAAAAGGCCRQSRVFINKISPPLTGCTQIDGYTQLMPTRQLDYQRVEALQVAGTDWVRKNAANAEIRGLRDRGDGWLAVPEPLPVVRLVSQARQSSDPARDLAGVDWRNTVLTEEPIELGGGTPGRASVIDRQPGRFELSVDAPSRQILAVAESYHAGWQANVDGTPEAVFRVDGDFLGCQVGPGHHRVELVFQPRSLHDGISISLAAILLCCLWTAGIVFVGSRQVAGKNTR